MDGEFTVTASGFYGFGVGDLIEIQGAVNDQFNTQAEIVAVCSGGLLVMRRPSHWSFLRSHFRRAWLEFRWKVGDAYLELCDIWDEAKTDWRSTF
jgi:hypothetical protein